MEKKKRPDLDELQAEYEAKHPKKRRTPEERAAIAGTYMEHKQLELGVCMNNRDNLGLPINQEAFKQRLEEQTAPNSLIYEENPENYWPDRRKKHLRTSPTLCLDIERARKSAIKDELCCLLQPDPLAPTLKEYKDYTKCRQNLFPLT